MLLKHLIVICCVAWTLLTGYFDFRTGSDVSMLLLYAAPVLIAARYCGRLEGLVVAGTAGVCWLWGNYVHLKSGASVPLLSWNAANRLGVFALIAYTIALQAQPSSSKFLYCLERPLTEGADGHIVFTSTVISSNDK